MVSGKMLGILLLASLLLIACTELQVPQDDEDIGEPLAPIDEDDSEEPVEYGPPFNDKGTWRTVMGDAGSYESYVEVDDGVNLVRREFLVFVDEMNTAPKLEAIEDIYVDEGDTIYLEVDASDREQEDLFISIDGFMITTQYTTGYDDAWEDGCSRKGCTAHYEVEIIVSDGELEASQTVNIYVSDKNRPPIFKVPA
ncbi:hypothetical protein ACFL1B_05630 [Nanoarchaeota archaeon]